jgi:hypothetical protein
MVRTAADEPADQRVLDDISRCGWHAISIPPDSSEPGFVYSVGLWQSLAHPELIVVGLQPKVAHQVINLAVEARKRGEPYDVRMPALNLLADVACEFVKVAQTHYRQYVGYCRWYYEGNGFELYQIVWPSREGIFPWDRSASASFVRAQPILGSPPAR